MDALGEPGRRTLFDELAELVEKCLATERQAIDLLR
jgi:hypothetical protein